MYHYQLNYKLNVTTIFAFCAQKLQNENLEKLVIESKQEVLLLELYIASIVCVCVCVGGVYWCMCVCVYVYYICSGYLRYVWWTHRHRRQPGWVRSCVGAAGAEVSDQHRIAAAAADAGMWAGCCCYRWRASAGNPAGDCQRNCSPTSTFCELQGGEYVNTGGQ